MAIVDEFQQISALFGSDFTHPPIVKEEEILFPMLMDALSDADWYEIQKQTPEFGYRLDGLLRKRRDRLFGILNGVDYADWNPATDKFIIRPFDPTYLDGKKECRRDLLRAFSLNTVKEEPPVVGMVSRLAGQKGFDIVCESLEEIFKMGSAPQELEPGPHPAHHCEKQGLDLLLMPMWT